MKLKCIMTIIFIVMILLPLWAHDDNFPVIKSGTRYNLNIAGKTANWYSVNVDKGVLSVNLESGSVTINSYVYDSKMQELDAGYSHAPRTVGRYLMVPAGTYNIKIENISNGAGSYILNIENNLGGIIITGIDRKYTHGSLIDLSNSVDISDHSSRLPLGVKHAYLNNNAIFMTELRSEHGYGEIWNGSGNYYIFLQFGYNMTSDTYVSKNKILFESKIIEIDFSNFRLLSSYTGQ